MAAFIDVRDLTKRYGAYVALDSVSLDVAEGEFLALLGPSGCGKTTLLRSIAGFVDDIEGSIAIEGRSMVNLPPNRRPVNTVFQNYALFPHMTVADNVAYGPRRNGAGKAEAKALATQSLETVGMGAFRTRFPAQLSGGQQQRVALARAIANRPKVLLLDEPLGALDLKLRKQMQMELKALQQALGMTFIFVTHDQEEALVMADRIAVMEAGRIVQIGTGSEVYHKPATRYVADFIGEANLIPCKVQPDRTLAVTDSGLQLAVPLPDAAASGAAVTCLVRPEVVGVHAGAPQTDAGQTALQGTVRQVVFVGNATRVYVDIGGLDVIAQIPSSSHSPGFHAGQPVHVSWHGEDARVLVK